MAEKKKNIEEALKEHTKDILSEETLGEIETAFNEAVEERANLQVEAALVKQDEDHAIKVQGLLEAIDDDHTSKLTRIVEAVNANHFAKLKNVIRKYEGVVYTEAGTFKNNMVNSVSNYLDLYLERTFPTDMLDEAIKNKRALSVLEDMRQLLGVDMALARQTIKEAVLDGKQQLEESNKAVDDILAENKQLTQHLTCAKAEILLEDKCKGLPEEKKKYMKRVLGNKEEQFITENFEYTLDLFDKEQDKQFEQMRSEARHSVKGNVAPLIESTDVRNEQPVTEEDDPMFNSYMGELSKY